MQYFQEKLEKDCGNCDCCDNPRLKIDGSIIAQKLMSAIYRTGQKFGINYIIDILLGVKSERAQKYGHIDLPTFGIGTSQSKEIWLFYANQLIDLGIIDIKYDGYIKTLGLNKMSMEILTNQKSLELIQYKPKVEKVRVRQVKGVPELTENDIELFERLRELRSQIAKREKIPPFIVFGDQTLQFIARIRPKNLYQFADISGVGRIKLQKYGREFLAII